LALDGNAQYGVISSGYSLGGDFSVEVLVRPISGGSQRSIMSKFDCTDGGYDISLDASNRAVLTIFSSCLAGASDTLRSLTPLPNGAWTHLAIARNAVTNRYTIYINGISDAVLLSSRSPGASANPLFIGAKDGTSDFFAGSLDEIRLWNTNLSTVDNSTEGALVRYRGIEVNSVHPRWSSLVGYWKCNDIAGASLSNSVSGAAMNLIGAPSLVGGSTGCSVVADVAAPVQWQLLGTKQGGSVTFATIDAMNGGAALGTVSITSSGMMTYTPVPPILTTNITDNFQYRISDGMGSVSTASVFVHFAPASSALPAQTVEAGTVALLPPEVAFARGGLVPFSITHTPQNFALPLSGDLTTNFNVSTTTTLTLTRFLTDRHGLTAAQPITITPVFTPTTLAFSSVSSAGTDGLPPLREFRSGVNDSVTVGVFTSFGFAAPVPNANLQVTIAPFAGGVAQFQIIGNTAILTAQSFRTINPLRIFWLNSPFLGGTTQATLTAHIFGAGSVQSTSLAVTVRASALTPEITSVSPVGGIVGTTITISGVYFGTPLSVRFGSVVASGVTLLSSTQLSVVVPVGAVNAPITVDFVNGTATSSLNFQVVLPPIVDMFDPNIGSTGTTVTINGINFIAPLRVFFGDSAATRFRINSSMEIEAIVGGGMTGKVRVVTLGGIGISDSTFRYLGRPTITGFSPTVVSLGAQVCILGTNFSADDLLFVGDVPIVNFTFISPTSICFTLDSAISGMVSIVTDVGSANAAEILRYLAPPTITSFSPSVVASNGVVVIRGQNFINVTSVTIGSATFASFHVDSPTQITVRLTGGQQQSTTISVSTPAGTIVSVGQLFIVEPPQIATFAPLLAGRGSFITITGANFTAEPLPRVQFGFAPSDSVIFISSTQISVRVPAFAQSGRFIVFTPGGVVSSAQSLFVILPPTITDFDPMRGSTGTTVNVRGTYFYEISAVRFGTATAASFRIESPELIIAQVGRGETGLVSVIGSQGIAKSTEEFEFVRNLALPIITEFTPASGRRGSEVEITGRNFGGAVAVRFGGVEAQFTVISNTRINATVQGGTSGQVQVTTPNGTATSLEAFQFLSDTIKVVAQTQRQQDSSILVRLYATTTGQQWLRQRAWLSEMPISSWAGVTVEHDRVVGLLLPSNNLRGNLPAFLGQLTDIEVLDMSFNELSGEIPAAITSLPKLRILELNNNQLSGAYPNNFGTTATLQILHLQHNVLTGALNNASAVAVYDSVANTIISSTTAIAATCGLRNLRELNVSANRLTGVIPPCIGNLTALTMLNVSNNALEDIIPASLGACVNLREIYLSSNMLRGSIAPLFQGATELRILDLSDNLLTDLPAGRVVSAQLETLLLQKNQFSGAVPQFLTNLISLRTLDISDNSFSGVLPSELRALKHLQRFSITNNHLQGVIPSALGEMDSLRVLNLSNNTFADSVPASIGALRQLERLVLAHNRLTWLPSLRSLRLLKELNVAENRLTFEHCEANVIVPTHIYAPQDSIGAPSTATLRVGQVAEFPLRIGGETNQYQWFRNGIAVALQRARSLRFAAFSRSDIGTYSCRITSSDARLSTLKLFSRPIEIRALAPAAPKGTIALLAPKQNAASAQTQNILFSWVALLEASSYQIQIARTPDFVSIVQDSIINQAGFIVAKLSYLSRYYWRVRGINEGLSTAWSEVRQFATLGESDRITLERIDFGGVAVGSVSAPQKILLRNATGEPIVISGLRIEDGSQSSLSGAVNFRISSQPPLLESGGTALDSTSGYGFVFAPRSPSTAGASLTVLYHLTSGTVEQTQTFSAAMVGFGSILSAAPLDFDSLVVGKGIGRVQELQVTNRAGGISGRTFAKSSKSDFGCL
jgi:Leucine-rich repeat (LRR) protein